MLDDSTTIEGLRGVNLHQHCNPVIHFSVFGHAKILRQGDVGDSLKGAGVRLLLLLP